MSEFDETFALDCYNGKKLDSSFPRKPRRHGAKVEKRGPPMSMCASAQVSSVRRDAIAATVNRAKPSAGELADIFEGHIADGTLAFCDGLRSYHVFPELADCTVKDCNDQNGEDSCF